MKAVVKSANISDRGSSRTHIFICDALRNLVPYVQFKKRKKHPWRSANFSKVADWSLKLY